MRTLYHDSIYDFARPVPSYWEATAPKPSFEQSPLEGEESVEVAAGHIGWGASGRNGGFCCFPATKMSISQMIKTYGLEETKAFWASQVEGARYTAELGEREEIDFEKCGDGLYDVAHRPDRFEELREYGETLTKKFDVPTKLLSQDEFLEIGHGGSEQFGALHIGEGFALHPLRFTLGLGEAAARHGAILHGHSKVENWTKEAGKHLLVTNRGRLKADKVVVACNGFMPEGLHKAFAGRVVPALSNILVTRPLSDEELAAEHWKTLSPLCNTRTLLFYYRQLPDKRILFGARGDTTGRPEDGAKMRHWMEKRFAEVFPSYQNVTFDYFWRGLTCVTQKLLPSIGRLEDDPSVYYGYAYHANGVNTAPWSGRAIARLIAGNSGEAAIPKVYQGMAPKIPFAAFRLWGLRAAYAWYRYKDDR